MAAYETTSLWGDTLIAQVLLGAIPCVLVAGGVWSMKTAASVWDDQHQEAKDRYQETMLAFQRHEETLRALTGRTAPSA